MLGSLHSLPLALIAGDAKTLHTDYFNKNFRNGLFDRIAHLAIFFIFENDTQLYQLVADLI